MTVNAEQLRFVLGLKLKSLRQHHGLTLAELAARADLSVSYLSEVEQGRKYPKPERLLGLARALGVGYDELVSMQVEAGLDAVKSAFSSEFLKDFPFALFGVEPADLFRLAAQHPERAGALLRALLDVARTYDVETEQFLLAALRAYQQLNRNDFPDLEAAAVEFRRERGWLDGKPPDAAGLARVLERDWGYEIDEQTLPAHRDLRGFRSVYLDGRPPRLLVNGRLLPSQKAFVLAREIGHRRLGLKARSITSSWIKAESFEQVLNNFRASYFAGALLIDRRSLCRDLAAFFAHPRWDGAALLALLRRYRATPEMFFHRLTEILPAEFGLEELFFARFHAAGAATAERYRLTKVFSLARVAVPHGVGRDETHCRRWPDMRLHRVLAGKRRHDPAAAPVVMAQRSVFLESGAEFFVLACARPLALGEADSTVSIGLLMNDAFRARVRFAEDPKVPRVIVNLTCERCPLAPAECQDRAAPPVLWERREAQERQEKALQDLLSRAASAPLGPAREPHARPDPRRRVTAAK